MSARRLSAWALAAALASSAGCASVPRPAGTCRAVIDHPPSGEELQRLFVEHRAPLILAADQAYVCSCTERKLSGAQEQRAIGGAQEQHAVQGDREKRAVQGDLEKRAVQGDAERRAVAGDLEKRAVAGDQEQRKLGGADEARKLGGADEARKLGGESEARKLGGATEALSCEPHPECSGYLVPWTRNGRVYDGVAIAELVEHCVP